MQHVPAQPFPSPEERAALRNQYLSKQQNPQVNARQGNAMAKRAAAAAAAARTKVVHPQTGGASVTMHSQPLDPSPRVKRMHAGTAQDPRPGPSVDPKLVAALEGQQPRPPQPQPQMRPQVQRHVEEYPAPDVPWHATPRPQPQAADVRETGIQNPMPGYVVPIADSGGSSLALPSRFAYYAFKDLYVCPFRTGHLAKLQRAASEKSMQPLVEAVATVVYSSEPQFKNIAFDLSVPDFFTVLYWLRLNSFMKMKFTHRDVCRNPDHLQSVKDKKRDEKSLLMQTIIDKTMVKVHDLEYIPDPAEFDLGPDSPFYIAPPTMRDVIEYLDHPMLRNPNTRVEFSHLAQKVSHLHGHEGYVSIDERIEWYEQQEADLGYMLEQFRAATKDYGVDEHVEMNCSVCGARRRSSIVLDATSFLPRA